MLSKTRTVVLAAALSATRRCAMSVRGKNSVAALPDNIDGEERGRDIVAAAHQRPRGACTEIEVPGGHSGEASMTTTTRHRNVPDLRNAKAAPGSMHHRPARRFKRRSSGTIRTKGLGSWGSPVAVTPSFM